MPPESEIAEMLDSQFHQKQNTEVAVAVGVIGQTVNHLKDNQEKAEARIKALEKDRDNALRWGIIVLGSTVISLGLWIFNLIEKQLHLNT